MQRLHLEVLKVEFNQFNVDEEDSISMRDFAGSIVSAEPAGMYKERLDKLLVNEGRVTFQQVKDLNSHPLVLRLQSNDEDTYA
jgi:hypothetical protein